MNKQVYVCGETEFNVDAIIPMSQKTTNEYYINKPNNGFWTSSLVNNSSAWIEWCASEWEGKLSDTCVVITPKKDINVFTIDNEKDLISASTRKCKYLLTQSDVYMIDFWRLYKEGYYGVHVTENAAWSFHYSAPLNLVNLNAWDCESTVWFDNTWIDSFEIKKIINYKIA